THRAGLILSCLVMCRTLRTLRRERVTLQAQQVDLANPQEAWVCRAVRRVATTATFCLHRHMFVNKRSFLVDMTVVANAVATRHCPYLAESGCAVNVVAVAALDQSLIDPMVIWFGEVSLLRSMASVAQIGLLLS